MSTSDTHQTILNTIAQIRTIAQHQENWGTAIITQLEAIIQTQTQTWDTLSQYVDQPDEITTVNDTGELLVKGNRSAVEISYQLPAGRQIEPSGLITDNILETITQTIAQYLTQPNDS